MKRSFHIDTEEVFTLENVRWRSELTYGLTNQIMPPYLASATRSSCELAVRSARFRFARSRRRRIWLPWL